MRRALLMTLLLSALGAAPSAAAPQASLPDIEDEVMCVQCKTPLNLSTAAVAEREREFIRDEIARGKTKDEIKAGLVERFGPAVLATPDDEGFGLTAYLVRPLFELLSLAPCCLERRGAGPPGLRGATGCAPRTRNGLDRALAANDP